MTDDMTKGYLSKGLVLRGRLLGTGDIELDSDFKGEISMNGVLTIGRRGYVRAPVFVSRLQVAGELEGSVSSERLEICDGGSLLGDVQANALKVADGARIEGCVSIRDAAVEDTAVTAPTLVGDEAPVAVGAPEMGRAGRDRFELSARGSKEADVNDRTDVGPAMTFDRTLVGHPVDQRAYEKIVHET